MIAGHEDALIADVTAVVARTLGRPPPGALDAPLGIDSLQTVELIAAVEARFGVAFADDDLTAETLGSVAGLADLVRAAGRAAEAAAPDDDARASRLRPRDADPLAAASVTLEDYERRAQAALDPGIAAYIASGAGDEVTLRDNRAAFARWRIEPRVLRGHAATGLACRVLGTAVRSPILVAPMAYMRLAHHEGELAMARAAAQAGSIMCLSTFASHAMEDVAAEVPGAPQWFQLYAHADRGLAMETVRRAAAAGFRALVVTVDLPVYGRRDRESRTGFAVPRLELPNVPSMPEQAGPVTPCQTVGLVARDLSWDDIARFAAHGGMPVVVKGVLSPADAVLAAEHGAAGVVVSNHGGRQLDTTPASIDALARVADAAGDRLEILMDGGVRRGTDVVKALALGARAVMVGRPALCGLALEGAAGATAVLDLLAAETVNALALTGCSEPADATRDLVYRD